VIQGTPDVPERGDPAAPGLARRHLFGYAGAAGAGAIAGGLAGAGLARAAVPPPAHTETVIRQAYSPHGPHQAGIVTPTPAVTRLAAFTLDDLAAEPLAKLLRLWSGDIQALMAGTPIPGDPTPELARPAASLSVTVGLGPRVFTLPTLRRRRPDGLVDIPAMHHDRLLDRWSGGDVVAIVAADDATTVDYAARRLTRDAAPFARPAWVQDGSWRGTDASGAPVTGRNLFGQLDGTGNPTAEDLDRTVWAADPQPWFAGGTTLVVRRIEMDLDFWDRTTRERQEKVIGRRLDTGAPLTGTAETDALDLAATDDQGRPVIPADAHSRRSHPDENAGRRILRRGLNYTHTEVVDGEVVTSAGLVFLAFCANIAQQFVPIQNRLDQNDALNDWTHAIGSAVFAIPGGFARDDWLARGLFE
jgi:dye decolorizing peroxidase